MLIAGCCCCEPSDAGAFGFSNERSLVYCASTLSWGAACSTGAPLPLVMTMSPEATLDGLDVRRHALRCCEYRCRASGYHSPGSVHKDDEPKIGLARGGQIPARETANPVCPNP